MTFVWKAETKKSMIKNVDFYIVENYFLTVLLKADFYSLCIITDSKLMDLSYIGLIYLTLSPYLMLLLTWQEEQSNYFSVGYKLIILNSSFKRSIVLENILKQHA